MSRKIASRLVRGLALSSSIVWSAGCAGARVPLPAAGAMPAVSSPFDGQLVDLTHAFDAATIAWPTEKGFVLDRRSAGETAPGAWYAANVFSMPEHAGTHLDAPYHFAAQGETSEQIPLEKLVGPAEVVDASEACARDRDHAIDRADLDAHERLHGPIPRGAIVLLRTGYFARWPDRAAYLGTDARGPEAVRLLHFPGLEAEAARWLAEERGVRAIGIDTASIDPGPSTDFAAHRVLAARDVPIFENVAALDRVPTRGASVVALPMKIAGGTGGPLRIVAVVPWLR